MFLYKPLHFLVLLACGLGWCLPLTAATISGKVLDVEGAPVEGAAVFLGLDRKVRTATAGTDGGYRFGDVQVGVMELVAHHPEYAMDGVTVVPIGDMEINLVLTEPGMVPVRVINNDFMPVPGARVLSLVVNDRFVVSVEDLARHGFNGFRSNDDGLLDITGIPADGYIKMTLTHHQYAPSDVAYLPVDTRRRDIILYKGARVRGRITAEGEPVADARVSLFQVGVGGQRKFAETITDPEGFYHMRASEDQYLIAARHRDYASPPPGIVDMTDSETTAVADIELLPPYIIRGEVLLPDETPCPGARILFRVEETIFEDTYTDSEGRFTLRSGSAEGVLRVIPPPGYMTRILADIPVSLGDTRDTRLAPIELVQLPVVRGRAVFPDGVESERLYLRSLDLPAPIHLSTEEDGSFEIPFRYQPDQSAIAFRLEHPLRFLRRDFVVNLEAPADVEVLLEPFEPDLERRTHQPGRNNLDPLLGEPAPPIECSDWFNTHPVEEDDLKNTVVVLTLWGGFDTSLFAMNRLTELRVLHSLLSGQDDVVILAVHDASSEPEEIDEYLLRYDLSFPVGRDEDPFVTFVNYGINAIPQTVLIDKQGVLRYAQTEGRLLELIKALRRRP